MKVISHLIGEGIELMYCSTNLRVLRSDFSPSCHAHVWLIILKSNKADFIAQLVEHRTVQYINHIIHTYSSNTVISLFIIIIVKFRK